jgi:hypothetical protein
MVDEEGRMALVEEEATLVAMVEADEEGVEGAGSTTEASGAYRLASGEEARHRQSENESQASAGEEDVIVMVVMTGVVAVEEEEDGSHDIPYHLLQ